MLPRADTLGTRSASAAEAPLPVSATNDPRQEVFHRLAQLAVGRQFQAKVVQQLEDGTFIVKVGDTQARVVLPKGTQVGDSIQMSMLTARPRPVFLLSGDAGSVSAQLSDAGKLISAVLKAAKEQAAPLQLNGKGPLVRMPQALEHPDATPHVAAAMQQALSESGVFYESHLQQWVAGARSAAELLKEPQAAFSRPPPPASSLATLQDLTQLLSHAKSWSGTGQELSQFLHNLPPTLSNATGPPTDADTIFSDPGQQDQLALSPDTVKMVNQQLHTLENRQIVWQGELWPGQKMEWEVADETPAKRGGQAEEPTWKSVVRIQLPLLGDISASIHLQGNQVQVEVTTGDAAASSLLTARAPALADALSGAGAELRSFKASADEQA